MDCSVKVKEEYYDILSTINRKYKFIDIDSNNFDFIMSKITDLAIKIDHEDVEIKCEKCYKKYISNSIKKGDISFLDNFIKNNLVLSNDYMQNINQIRNLYNVLNDMKCSLSIEMIIQLTKGNKLLNQILDNIYNSNCKNKIYSVKSKFDVFLITFLDVYCEEKNMEIKQSKTFNQEYSNDFYLNAIRKTSLLSPKETIELFEKYHKGDLEARNKIIESNLRLVVSVAKRFRVSKLEFLDLVDYGVIGLIKAIERFDLSKNCQFSTYATWWIRHSITNAYFECENSMNNDHHILMMKFDRYVQEYYVTNGSYPTDMEVIKYLNITDSTLKLLKSFSKGTISLNDYSYNNDDKDIEIVDTIPDSTVNVENDIELDVLKHDIIKLFNQAGLTYNEMYIIINRYGLGNESFKTYDELRKYFNCSGENVRLMEKRALKKMRLCPEVLNFVNYLDNPDMYRRASRKKKKSIMLEGEKLEDNKLSSSEGINDPFLKNDYVDILNFILQLGPSKLTTIFNDKELSFIYLQTNYLNNKRYSLAKLSKVLLLDKTDIIEILKSILTKTEQYICDIYNNSENCVDRLEYAKMRIKIKGIL